MTHVSAISSNFSWWSQFWGWSSSQRSKSTFLSVYSLFRSSSNCLKMTQSSLNQSKVCSTPNGVLSAFFASAEWNHYSMLHRNAAQYSELPNRTLIRHFTTTTPKIKILHNTTNSSLSPSSKAKVTSVTTLRKWWETQISPLRNAFMRSALRMLANTICHMSHLCVTCTNFFKTHFHRLN